MAADIHGLARGGARLGRHALLLTAAALAELEALDEGLVLDHFESFVRTQDYPVGGAFLITTAQLGPNLWIGNHPGASGRYEPLRPGRGDARYVNANLAVRPFTSW